ncbi:hypothetical protein V1477_019546 [Vespula maculifrons]|uniref:Uncharacterized protein n=1 Tax=Vespula maculifrons TaxID=7453 RepID=A0ABD2AR19_VESMC
MTSAESTSGVVGTPGNERLTTCLEKLRNSDGTKRHRIARAIRAQKKKEEEEKEDEVDEVEKEKQKKEEKRKREDESRLKSQAYASSNQTCDIATRHCEFQKLQELTIHRDEQKLYPRL